MRGAVPKYRKSNREPERTVHQTMKNLLTKAEDPRKALQAYSASPLANVFSPAKLCIVRILRIALKYEA